MIALILIGFGVLLAFQSKTLRRQHRLMTQVDDVLQATLDLQSQVTALTDQQTKTGAAILAAIARVEAVIAALQNQNNPQLEGVINSLHAMKDTLAGAVATEQQEQATLDAERPAEPPPAQTEQPQA